MSTLVELKDVHFAAAGFQILKGVTGIIESGSTLFITGKSGSGKSTLIKIACGLNYPTTGEVFIRGQNLREATNDGLRSLHEKSGFVFQDRALISNMNVYENIALPLRYHLRFSESEIRERVMTILSKMELEHDAQNRPTQLSLGEQKLASIARAVVSEPDLVYFDEPFGGLDSGHMQKVMDVLKELKAKKCTMVILSSKINHIKELGDRLWLLSDGKLAFNAPADDESIYNHPLAKSILEY